MVRNFILGWLIAGLASAGALAAQPNDYNLVWIIDNPTIPAGRNWYRGQAGIVSARLVPEGVFQLAGEAKAVDGTLVAPAGLQFFKVSARKMLACSLAKAATESVAASKRICLVDEDRDGRFDRYFVRGHIREYYILNGKWPKDMRPLAPVAYAAIPVADSTLSPYFSFHYQRYLDGGFSLPIQGDGKDAIRFHFKVSDKPAHKELWLIRHCMVPTLPSYCAKGPVPTTFEFAGLKMNILERRKEDLLIEVTQSFAQQRVMVGDMTTQYYDSTLVVVNWD